MIYRYRDINVSKMRFDGSAYLIIRPEILSRVQEERGAADPTSHVGPRFAQNDKSLDFIVVIYNTKPPSLSSRAQRGDFQR